MERHTLTDVRNETMPLSPTRETIAYCAAWLDIRAKSVRGSADDRARAAATSYWLKHWLQGLCSPATTAFIAACAEREVMALAGGMESPIPTP